MYVGSGNLCLRVEDLERSIRFYEALGLKRASGEGAPGVSALMRRGNLSIFLADAFDVCEHLCSEGLEPTSKPSRQDDGGTNWMTQDPDGHGIFFNTHKRETTSAHRQAKLTQLLHDTEQDLVDLGASAECLQAFREHVLTQFGSE